MSEVKFRRPRSVITGVVIAVGGLAGGTLFGSYLYPEPGRGEELTNCPDDYDGLIKVDNKDVLHMLGVVAKDREIRDSEAQMKSDIATLPGELACRAVINHGTNETVDVLLPTGIQALDQGGSNALMPGSSTLPEGLSWR